MTQLVNSHGACYLLDAGAQGVEGSADPLCAVCITCELGAASGDLDQQVGRDGVGPQSEGDDDVVEVADCRAVHDEAGAATARVGARHSVSVRAECLIDQGDSKMRRNPPRSSWRARPSSRMISLAPFSAAATASRARRLAAGRTGSLGFVDREDRYLTSIECGHEILERQRAVFRSQLR